MINVLDRHGNINSDLLSKEILQSLTEDIKIKQIDDAKKRAVKSSATFDEFKSRVSCAHMKCLSHDEVLSLRDVKKGWSSKKSSASMLSNKNSGLSLMSVNNEGSLPINHHGSCNATKAIPKTVENLERNLKQFVSVEDTVSYLLDLSLENFTILMGSSSNVDIFDIALNAFTLATTASDEDCVSWISLLSNLSSFNLLHRFMSSSQKSQLSTFMSSIKSKFDKESITQKKIELIISNYELSI